MSEKSRRGSPYNYVENNPIVAVDPDGMETQVGGGATLEGLQDMYGSNNVQVLQYNGNSSGPPKKNKATKNRYFSTFWNQISNYNFGLSVTTTWDGWLSENSTLPSDLGAFWNKLISLGSADTWTDKWGDWQLYFNGPSDYKGLSDGVMFNRILSGYGTFAPVGEAGGLFKNAFATTRDGFLGGSMTLKTPFDIPVQRFGNMSLGKPDFWGLRIGSSAFANRTFAAILPEWNPLTQYTTGIIPKGSTFSFGIIGPQGWAYPGGSLQFIINSSKVIKQISKLK